MLFLRVLQCFFICGRGRTYNECFLRVLRHIYSPLQIQCFCCSLLRVVVAAWRIFDLHTVFPLERDCKQLQLCEEVEYGFLRQKRKSILHPEKEH